MVVCVSMGSVVISPLSFFIASVWFLCLFLFISLTSSLSILLIFSKNHLLVWFIFRRVFCVSISFSSALILVIYCLLLAFEFFWSCSSSSLNFDVRISILDLSLLLMWAFIAINFPLDTALKVSQRFWYAVSLSHWFWKMSFILFLPSFCCLSSHHSGASCSVFYVIEQFWVSFLILSCNLIALWAERLLVMISVVLHLLSSALLPIMWSILE